MEREKEISFLAIGKSTEQEIKTWVDNLNFEKLGLEDVDTSVLRTRTERYEDYHHNLLSKYMFYGPSEVFQYAESLIKRKSAHISSVDFTPNQRILIAQLGSHFSTHSLAEALSISRTSCEDILHEVVGAIHYVEGIPHKNLHGEKIKYFIDQYTRIENSRLETNAQLTSMGIIEEFKNEYPLNIMISRFMSDGAISFLMRELGLDDKINMANINYNFKSFLEDGEINGGLTWMRKVAYQKWITSKNTLFNYHDVPIHRISTQISNEVVSLKREKDPRVSATRRRTYLFFNYLSLLDLEELKKNQELENIDFENLIQKPETECLRFYTENSFIPRLNSQLSFFAQQYVDGHRETVIEDISSRNKIASESARKVYDVGLSVIDTILLERDISDGILDRIHSRPISTMHKKYIELTKRSNENAK